MRRDGKLSARRVRELLVWEPGAPGTPGRFLWAQGRPGVRARSVAGYKTRTGHYQVSVDGWPYELARVAFNYWFGRDPIGAVHYRNGDPSDLSEGNLFESGRVAPVRQKPLRGTTYLPRVDKYQAQFYDGAKTVYLGRFDTEFEAHEAWKAHKERSSFDE